MRASIGTVAAALIFLSLGVEAVAQDFVAYEGMDAVQQGRGGNRKTVDGIDFWSNGSPPKRFQVLGTISDERHKTGLWGLISMSNLERDVAKEAKKAGGDAVVLADAHDQVISMSSSVFGSSNGNCNGSYNGNAIGNSFNGTFGSSCNSSGFALGDTRPIEKHDSSYYVVKYLPDAPAGSAAAAQPPGGASNANLASDIQAALDAKKACDQQTHTIPEYARIKDKMPSLGQESGPQLIDSSLATDGEIDALRIVQPQIQACLIVLENALQKSLPDTALLFASLNQENDAAYADLAAKKLAWGVYLRKRKAIADEFTRGMAPQLARVGLN